MRIVIPGGNGQVGQLLARHFFQKGDGVVVLARKPQLEASPWRTLQWNGRDLDPTWTQELEGADLVINLAGRSVNCRYTDAKRREIMESRIDTTRIVGCAIAACARPPALWMNASTATIYRHALDHPIDEVTGELGGREPGIPSTWKFSIDVATAWEREFFAAPTPQTRKIALRSAMVMYPSRGGIFDTLLGLVRTGLGGSAADGNQFVSWIHGEDFIRALEFLVSHEELDGVVNVCSPNPLPDREFMRELRQAAGIRIGFPATKWMLEIGAFFLRTETELILKSRRVVPGLLLKSGFAFKFPDWSKAAQDLVQLARSGR